MKGGALVIHCAECGVRIIPTTTYYRELVGWAMSRRAGGANAIRLERPTGRYLCSVCWDRLTRQGVQAELFPHDE